MASTEYITKAGDRWDLIAYKAYGTVYNVIQDDGTVINAMSLICNSNPGIALVDVLDEGLLLNIPILRTAAVSTDAGLLPPWKSST